MKSQFGCFCLIALPVHGASAEVIAYEPVMETALEPVPHPSIEYSDTLAGPAEASQMGASAIARAVEPVTSHASSVAGERPRIFNGGKLLLTNGVTSLEGASGGGIAAWAVIAGLETEGGIGVSSHFTAVELPDFGWRSYGAAIGISDRLELSYARQNFDTREAGSVLGLGRGFTFNQDIYAAKARLAGDVVYGSPLMPQISAGVQYKRNLDAPIIAALGSQNRDGVDFTLSATKLFLEHSLMVNATGRLTKGNQLGLVGFGGPDDGYKLQFEGSLAYMLSRRAVIGAEYRSKPDNLGLGEDDWLDIFAAYAVNDKLTLSAAYVDLGSIATFEGQRGGFVQAQVSF